MPPLGSHWLQSRVSRNLLERNIHFSVGKNIQMESNKSARMHAAGEEEAGGGQMLLTFLPIHTSIASEAV